MNKREFLQGLKEQLTGSMQEGRVAAHLRYYEDYIQSRIQRGESEEEILNMLGDPRLIAKTLLETEKSTLWDEDPSDHYRSYEETWQEESESRSLRRRFSRAYGLKSIFRLLLRIAALIAVLVIVSRLFVGLLPFAAIMAGAIFVLRLLDHNR